MVRTSLFDCRARSSGMRSWGFVSALALGCLSWTLPFSARAQAQTQAETQAQKRWTKLSTTGVGPSERSRPAVAAVGDKIFVFGGAFDDFSSGEFVFYNDLFVLETRTQRWRELQQTTPVPEPRGFAGHASLDGERGFVVFGGGTFGSDLSVVCFGDLWLFSASSASGPS